MGEVFALKVRIRFQKHGVMKFIGHLDVMRFFQKAMRRANIPIAFSGGYSPHMIMSFANPLGVGLTGDSEYFDIELTESITSKEAMERLNDVMVEGIAITGFVALPETEKTGMSIVAAAGYTTILKCGDFPTDWKDKLLTFFEQTSINILKKTKKSEREVDIKPLIYKLEAKNNDIYMLVAAGSVDNLKPGLVMDAYTTYLGLEKESLAFTHCRNELYADSGSVPQFIPLEELGTEII